MASRDHPGWPERDTSVKPAKVLSSEQVFDGDLIQVKVDTVLFPNGNQRTRETAHHPGAVAILPVLPDGRMVLVRQYRYATGRSLLEVPAGTLDPGESPEACALRELAEETGYRTGRLSKLCQFYCSPGWADEVLHAFVATDLTAGDASPEEDEDLNIVEIQPEDVQRLIEQGEIADAKTIVSLLGYLGQRLALRQA